MGTILPRLLALCSFYQYTRSLKDRDTKQNVPKMHSALLGSIWISSNILSRILMISLEGFIKIKSKNLEIKLILDSLDVVQLCILSSCLFL